MSINIKNPPNFVFIALSILFLVAAAVWWRISPGLAFLRWVFVLMALAAFILSFAPQKRAVWLLGKPMLMASFGAATLARAWPFTLVFTLAALVAVLTGKPSDDATITTAQAQPGAPVNANPAANAPAQVASAQIEIGNAVVFGKEGSGPGEFREPHGIAIGKDGKIYVADMGNKRVQILDQSGKFISEITSGKEPFKQVIDVAAANNGDIFVLDSERSSIERFDANGKMISSFGPNLGMYFPRGLALDAQNNIYIADTGGSRALKLTQAGEIIFSYGAKGKGAGEFTEPTGIAVTKDGAVFVADPTNRTLSVFKADGAFIGGAQIESASSVNAPKLVAAPDGTVLMSAPEPHLIRRYSNSGQPLAQFGGFGQGPGQFRLPTNMALSGNMLWVADTGNNRIQRIEMK